ncbi:hypothetical protein AGABI2DRAFT_193853 [Agaricus bisporus var. bisporus H97]|uniref:hypothetical protein n=1 Tax=Agaricus bisporus var. bisporus (strain H97 / ATCC MYA-4626 / FGSC 10389) TaxID=936046 RepID=UPI00029F7F12|nr:hypothetical protein AGABI2DRAFT_193853 [Agaricus bisporus var. bisporus H97]EKV45928.1 hypothetical protein AGABI2DRAFT_193853 [Agaricus bisporus var. bisporus H97]
MRYECVADQCIRASKPDSQARFGRASRQRDLLTHESRLLNTKKNKSGRIAIIGRILRVFSPQIINDEQ